ncbi:LysR family transcriptional regulator [Spartinivicinus poritis]|uniref:LysR family transcriptional regulator n=1 Tax=Spartinivicinus poritis TaxID=2994640 RepID=A0ABT5U805_9GAMM|nr:LysR family transcriptional regulator [Spartinivicinus sp. A2-2]MDE1462503.1 LysR family transcriptional regulator [Spartinivicinus sp. A2-2]
MKGTTFNQLTIFQTIVKEGSIRGAARKLEMAPPSVSQSLKQLESHLGLPLFSRSTRRIDLTDAGKLLYERISESINTLEFALESVQNLGEIPSGKVRLTLPRFAYQFFLRPIYSEFCRLYPAVQLEISVSDETINIISEGIDLGIRFGDRIEPGMVAKKITPQMKEALFASKEYIQKHGKPKTLDELKQHKLIQYRFIASNQLAPLILQQRGQEIIVDMPNRMIVNDTDLMVDAAEKGLGIGRIVTPMISEKLASGKLIPILEKHWQPYPGLYLYFLQNSQKAKRLRVFIDFLIDKGRLQQET